MTDSVPQDLYAFPVTVRYLEVDQQGVVFNAWYLAWFDEAMTAFLAHAGLPYADLLALGVDCQVVHTELDWTGAVGFGDAVEVQVSPAHVGHTSFTLDFVVRSGGAAVCTGRTVYVVVVGPQAAGGHDAVGTKAEVPEPLRAALGEVRPLKPQGRAPRA